MGAEIIYHYFPDLTEDQRSKFESLYNLYKEWNEKINVISRKDIEQLYEHHVLHSLAIAKFIQFTQGTKILDVGTGGGFPGIPLAIVFPDTHFLLADSIGKKIRVVTEIAISLGLKNVICQSERIEKIELKVDFVVSRAVTQFPQLFEWVIKNIKGEQRNSLRNGILYLKGDDTIEEEKIFKNKLQIIQLQSYFKEEFFSTKRLLYLPK